MNFVTHQEIAGVQSKEIPCMRGAGAPTAETEGVAGCLYLNTATGELYKCVAPGQWVCQESPVKSVNGETGNVSLSAADVGADPQGTAATAVSNHNVAGDSHNDIRLALKAVNDRLTAFFDSDDATLDELSEIVAYITANKTLIEGITTGKVNVADIANDLTTNVANKPLSAAQGVVLKGLIDTIRQTLTGKLNAAELTTAINTALAQAKASGEFDGRNGADGVSVTHRWNGTTLEVTSASGTSSANLKGDKGDQGIQGEKGEKGDTGAKGDKGDKGDTGATGAAGKTPVKGTDYYTEADKAEMVAAVIAALPDATEVSY